MAIQKTLSGLVNEIVKNQNTSVGKVENLFGSPVITPIGISPEGQQEWIFYTISDQTTLSPDDIVNRLSAVDALNTPIIKGVGGVLSHTPVIPGTTLYSTLIQLPQATGITVEVEAPNKAIALYTDETLVRRGANRATATINLPAGLSPLNIIVAGDIGPVTITIPSDIIAVIGSYTPPVPQWQEPVPITTAYVDPRTGNTGNTLIWQNQDTVGGWGIYGVNSTTYGTVTGYAYQNNKYILKTNYSGITSFPVTVRINNLLVGSATNIIRNDADNTMVFYIDAYAEYADYQIVSGTIETLTFNHLLDYTKSGGAPTISFVDTNVKAGQQYSYTLDSFAPFDRVIRSPKADIKTVTAGDITPPASDILNSITIINKQIYLGYTTPSDQDYLGSRVTYYYTGSGTGSIVNQSIVFDLGVPNKNDSLTFSPPAAGTYYLTTEDQAGNEQYVLSGVGFYWNGSSSTFIGPNQPPIVGIRQITTTEQSTFSGSDSNGIPYNSTQNYAIVEITAHDPEDSDSAVTVFYQVRNGSLQSYPASTASVANTVDNPAGTRSKYVPISRQVDQNWVKAYATDSVGAISDTMTYSVDFNNTPELSAFSSALDVATNTETINGVVDDDTKSLKWYLVGAIGGEPTIGSPTTIADLSSTKTFSFTFSLTDGQKKTLTITPYSEKSATGSAGKVYTQEFSRPPRTSVIVDTKTPTGALSVTTAQLTFTVTPPFTLINSGTSTGSNAETTLNDSGNPWVDGAYESDGQTVYYARITFGTGEGQARKIIANNTGTLFFADSWSIIPDNTSKYTIANGSTLYRVGGTGGYIPVFEPASIPRQITATEVDFFSEMNGVPQEPSHKITIDEGNVAEIATLQLFENTSNILSAIISDIDDDAKSWKLYARNGNYPTSGGGINDPVDPRYLRLDWPISLTSFKMNVSNGTWYVIVVPVNSLKDEGIYIKQTITINGSPTVDGQLSNFRISQHDNGTTAYYNELIWDHNAEVETPTLGTLYTVKLYGYRDDLGIATQTELTTGVTRDARKDIDGNFINTDDTNITSGTGSWLHQVGTRSNSTDGIWRIWQYEADLYLDGALKHTYNTNSGDYYVAPVPIFTGDSTTTVIAPGTQSGGDCTSPHQTAFTFACVDGTQNDTHYQIDIDLAQNSAGTIFSPLITGLSTYSTGYTLIENGLYHDAGGSTVYWKFKAKIVRKADGVVISTLTGSQVTDLIKNCLF